MAIIVTIETLKCVDCGDSLPPWTKETDNKVERPMKGTDGLIRCECCHDDYRENLEND